jgi:hypothetical protein
MFHIGMSDGKFVRVHSCGAKNEGEGVLMGFLVSREAVDVVEILQLTRGCTFGERPSTDCW